MASKVPSIDFHDYHRRVLPELLSDGRGAAAAESSQDLGSLAFRLSESGDAYRYESRDGAIEIASGDEATTVVELGQAFWEGLVHDLESAPGLLYGGFVKGLRGENDYDINT